ncbi:S1C family serine protease [Bifidobacterium thermophilum]|uniref:S1C family serine protease n=1 Tax=Bifidobacterium thermophilum TaxID=33905 RepID=UPI0030A43448
MADTNTGWENQPDQPQDDARQTVPVPPADQTTNDTSYTGESGEEQPTSVIDTNTPAAEADNDTNATQQPPAYTPAPEYGAYGPVPTSQTQPVQPVGATQELPPQHQQNPYGAYAGGYYGNDTGNIGAQPTGAQQPYGEPSTNPGAPQAPMFPPQDPNGPQGPFNAGAAPQNPDGRPAARKTANNVVVAVVAALVAAVLCLGVGYAAITNGWVTVPTTSSLSGVSSNTSGSGSTNSKTTSTDWTTVEKKVSASVVSIQSTISGGVAKGSGAIVDTKGYIVTNNHVISGATAIQVTLANGDIYSATVVGTDSTTDLAVIKLDNPPSDLTAVSFADSDKLAVGEGVMAIGNPLGYENTATTGIVSAVNRPVSVTDDNNNEVVTNAVQIDAAINPGNSGGPTFNAAGEVIGINSSIATASSSSSSSDSSGSIGIGFAIPSNVVKTISEEIIKDGKATHVVLGVTVKSANVEADGVTRGGAEITSSGTGSAVTSGSAADKAGLKAGDTIVAFNGNAVTNSYSLLGYVRAATLNEKVTLTIVRDGKTMDVDVTLDQAETSTSSNSSNGSGNSGNSGNSNGNGSNGSGNGSNDDDGGVFDPFGLW